ncbi:MAG: EF-P lysine aminoacylase EpmA [Gammaproteobacteria bacterium]|nr:EF-P lysine aminoacylase EpmA [Gammaproteobacteria bacterium]
MAEHSADWRPTASLASLRQRAELLAALRRYFAAQGVLEVETPLLVSAGATDPHIPSFSLSDSAASTGQAAVPPRRYLNTSPEFAMKRLLAAGAGPIFQVCKAFRAGEQGRHHNPEFSLLEWYRPGFDHHQLMQEVDTLVSQLAEGLREFGPVQYLSYHDCFQQQLGLDPHTATMAQLRDGAAQAGLPGVAGLADDDRDGWLDLLMSFCVQPQLGRGHLCFIYDYPESQAALARVRPGTPAVAERFELFIDGIELANGFHELQDAAEQRARFEADLAQRRAEGQEPMVIDERLLGALEAGLPACAGVALGLDRLLMVLGGGQHVREVLSFDYGRS